eukprot:6380181-Amphidinium_carterae.1
MHWTYSISGAKGWKKHGKELSRQLAKGCCSWRHIQLGWVAGCSRQVLPHEAVNCAEGLWSSCSLLRAKPMWTRSMFDAPNLGSPKANQCANR